jgi:hypothetical protein
VGFRAAREGMYVGFRAAREGMYVGLATLGGWFLLLLYASSVDTP